MHIEELGAEKKYEHGDGAIATEGDEADGEVATCNAFNVVGDADSAAVIGMSPDWLGDAGIRVELALADGECLNSDWSKENR